jgi:hypothetical protein
VGSPAALAYLVVNVLREVVLLVCWGILQRLFRDPGISPHQGMVIGIFLREDEVRLQVFCLR